MKTTDELLAIMAKMKGEPAPEYIYNFEGLAQRAVRARNPYYDELPEHSAPQQLQPKEKPK